MDKPKTVEQMKRETKEAVDNLPIETKKKFWKAMTKDGKNLGEAREIAGIDDVMVAAELVIQCHKLYHVPMSVEEIQ